MYFFVIDIFGFLRKVSMVDVDVEDLGERSSLLGDRFSMGLEIKFFGGS